MHKFDLTNLSYLETHTLITWCAVYVCVRVCVCSTL